MQRQIVSPDITVADAVQQMESPHSHVMPAPGSCVQLCKVPWAMQVKCKHGSLVITAADNRERLLGIPLASLWTAFAPGARAHNSLR